MTYIEFFEKDVLENLCTCLAAAPDKVILIGDNNKLMKKHKKRYERLLLARREVVEFETVSVDKNNIQSILGVLEEIVNREPECAFDITGGEDVYLVAMGIIFERYRNQKNIQMHHFNIRNNTVFDCDMDGRLVTQGNVPHIGVEELVYAYGGEVVFEEEYRNGTREWDWSDVFCDAVDVMWDICKRDVHLWNSQIDMLGELEVFHSDSEDELTTSVPMTNLLKYLEGMEKKLYINKELLSDLWRAGLITQLKYDDEELTVSYRDAQVKRCLTKAGQILELAVCAAARNAEETDGTVTYDDVMTGVTIDWDGEYGGPGETVDTANEIDVIMTRGLVPVFVSCKNGAVDSGELYKLNTVAGRFGGKYAKKALIATALNPELPASQYFIQRAEEMNIRVITNFQDLDSNGVNKLMRSLCR